MATVATLVLADDALRRPISQLADRSDSKSVVTRADLDTQAEGSAAQALLQWFRAVQQGRLESVLALTTAAEVERRGLDRVERAVAQRGRSLGFPHVSQSFERGDTTAVRAVVTGARSERGLPIRAEATTFELTRVGGRWRVSDLTYLIEPRS